MTSGADPLDALGVIDLLSGHASPAVLADMGPKYGIHTASAMGVSMANMKSVARGIGRDHDLAQDLWATGVYEARSVAALIDVPGLVTAAQMDRWCTDFDNWAICDTVCFNLFDRTSSAWDRVEAWTPAEAEFVKRGGFALLWSLALHDRSGADAPYLRGLELIEAEAHDDRRFVTNAIAMALRAISRRNPRLQAAAVATAGRFERSPDRTTSRLGRRAMRELGTTGA